MSCPANGQIVLSLPLLLASCLAIAADPKPADKVLESRGHIVPTQTVLLGSEVGGQVVEVLVQEGQRVKKGEVLVRLDPSRFEIDVKRRQALLERTRARFEGLKAGAREEEVKQAEAAMRRAEAEKDQARAEVERLRRLKQANTVTAEVLSQAETRFRLTESQLESARAALQLLRAGAPKERLNEARADLMAAEAELEQARRLLERTRLMSPIDGTILKKSVEVGGMLNGGAFPLGGVVCEIADLSRLEVEVPVSERDIGRIFTGQVCEVRTEAYPETVFKGQVARILPVLDRARGCFLVRVRLEAPNDKLRPEMNALVGFTSKQ